VALIPFSRKDVITLLIREIRRAGRFAKDIVATLQKLGTDNTSIIFGQPAVNTGDILRLNVTVPNTGPGGGTTQTRLSRTGGASATTPSIPLPPINNRTRSDNVVNDVAFQNSFHSWPSGS
jgi:hypothetical protein